MRYKSDFFVRSTMKICLQTRAQTAYMRYGYARSRIGK